MKSKDCLNLLMFSQTKVKNEYEFVNSKTKERLSIDDCYEIIMKDLDILDILKNESDSKRIIERDSIVSFHLDMILTIDNYNKIKEWLKNGY